MIETICSCGNVIHATEAAAGKAVRCSACNHILRLAVAEAVTAETALGDFDARLVITGAPLASLPGSSIGDVIALGGVPDLVIGKSQEAHIRVDGNAVSRLHAVLKRIDFGPSRWTLVDTQSRNGVFVNGHQVSERELHNGDIAQIGEYKLKFVVGLPGDEPAAPVGPDVLCSSCGTTYPAGTVICTTCGINMKTGRPLVTSREFDRDDVEKRIRIASYPMFFGIAPIASEGFGTHKATAIWWIAGITTVISVLFYIVMLGSSDEPSRGWLNLMLWAGSTEATHAKIEASAREYQMKQTNDHPRAQKRGPFEYDPKDRRLHEAVQAVESVEDEKAGEFHFYQLLTNTLLHADRWHLAGNLLFLLVFGLPVNELLGDLKTAIVYPILAVCASGIYLVVERNTPLHPALGASGAIMGLAGMYFVLFPVQRMHMAIWLRIWFIFLFRVYTLFFGYKTWRMRGFWLLLIWIGLNDILPMVRHSKGDHVAHWAHLGGFISGMIIALGLLLARQIHAHGGDILSVTLGSRAWALIGKPDDRMSPATTV